MMYRKVIFMIVLLSITLSVAAQYDERQILMQQANQHLIRREYNQAEIIYLQILEKDPSDLNAILQLMQIYFNLSATDKAETILRDYQRAMPENVHTEQRIQLLIMQGNIDRAYSEAEAYLQLQSQNQSKYRLLANYFDRRGHHEKTIMIYNLGRQALGGDHFAMEIGNANMRINRYEEALSEYLTYMKGMANLNLYVKNQISAILEQDSSLIGMIRRAAEEHKTDPLKELYASALLSLGRDSEALQIYKELPLNQMRNFAREQIGLENFVLARAATRHLAEHSPQPLQRLTYGYELASIFFQEALYDSTAVQIDQLLEDPYWSQSVVHRRNRLYVNIRKLRAENDLARGIDLHTIREGIQEAKQYSTVMSESQSLDLELARLAILSSDYPAAEEALQRVNGGDLSEKRDYLYYLLGFMQGQSTLIDSLMNEYIIHHPGGEYTNDMIYLNMLSLNMDENSRSTFAQSIKLLQLYQSAGIDSLAYLHEETGEEELLILAIEWAIGLGEMHRAAMYLEHEFADELSSEYAQFLRLALISDAQDQQSLAREFLKTKPNSIFSPRFRQVISRQAASQISI